MIFLEKIKKKYVETFGNFRRGFCGTQIRSKHCGKQPFCWEYLVQFCEGTSSVSSCFIISCKVLCVRVNCNRDVKKCSAYLLHIDCFSVCNSARCENSGRNILLFALSFQCNNTVIKLQRNISSVPIPIHCYANTVFGDLVFILPLRAEKERG